MILLRRLLVVCLVLTAMPSGVSAHALQPGFLEISPIAGESYRVFWRKPDVRGQPMAIEPLLPEDCTPRGGPAVRSDGLAWTSVWVATCPRGLRGGEILIEGLDQQRTDVLVRYTLRDAEAQAERLTPDRPSFIIPDDPGAYDVVRSYLPLGVSHILSGLDHLLFVFALLLLIPDRWRLIGAITAFTVAHSITMAVATFGWVSLPGPPVEAVIALSIMFLASELAQRDGQQERLSERYPWTVSFIFGLLHGFGFAGALREIGLPPTDVPLALFSFNLGVEIGQLMFVAAVLITAAILRGLWPSAERHLEAGGRSAVVGAYVIGTGSAVWFIQRLAAF